MTAGKVLFDEDGDFDRFFPVVVDTPALSNGWHSLGVRSRSEDSDTSVCGWCGDELHFTSGTAKIWFYVDNPPPDSPPARQPPPMVWSYRARGRGRPAGRCS